MTRPSLRTANLLAVSAAAWALAALALGVVGVLRPVPSWLIWPATVGGIGTAIAACRVAAALGEGPVRLLWRRFSTACSLLLAGVATQIVSQVILGNALKPMSPITAALFAAAAGYAMLAVFRLPTARRTWRAALATFLDVAIVGVAAAVVLTHFLRRTPDFAAGSPITTTLMVTVVVIASSTIVMVLKVSVTGTAPVVAPALWALAPGGLLGPAAWVLQPVLDHWPHLSGAVVTAPVAALLFTLAAWVQTRTVTSEPRSTRRRISLVPYIAVAVALVMLITVTLHTGFLPPDLAGGSVALTVLVMIRQLAALLDNTVLLDRMEDQAHHDDLTGLPNRRLFTTTLAERTAPTTVAVCDLDGFAALNDQLGDDTGDTLLRAAAERVAAVTGGAVVVARLLGDEFGVLMPGIDGNLAETLVDAFRTPLRVDDRDLLVTVTSGVATGTGKAVPDLLRRAELALQAAKYTGADRAREHTGALDATAQHHAELAAGLRRGLERGEFKLLYQPIVELPSGSVAGVEALIRWQPNDQPVISPAEFIPVAEHSGLIIDLGAWIIETACADAAAWQLRYGIAGPRVNINVSARQLLDPVLPGMVADALHRHGLTPDRITIEITETAVFAGGAALETVRELRELGVGVALDDFGTGHSSLTLLRTCPVTTLKVDKSFIDDLNGTAEQEAIASSLSTIASTLGLRAVAEGVETQDQADRLHALGYRYAQGFHFSRPIPAADIDALLNAPVLAA
ncbi:EAL domain-containing protein [Actinoplanes hulinensis]|uniref:EAL domain-containing protein n=1 Tax=Actinoplanes hulinensis TaxID=1144547 RepID=A0ABS7B6A7_9ACTN|nr:bifunctional diguanylate cyclase/phosphodiesterase [Actinoplanes hulinensis]MBW6436294.1 EAL domain-containing protein [Actinoplanes hulinensis]